MVCAALGNPRSEIYWARVLGSYNFGTPASRVTRLRQLGYDVRYGSGTLDELTAQLHAGSYVIVFVDAGELPWSDFDGFHALVLTSIEPEAVFLHDPALPEGSSRLSREAFLLAWDEFDNLAAIIGQ